MKIFSYVVDHDEGREPNPYFGTCTLCRCKYGKKRKNVVELAAECFAEGDDIWLIGTGGQSPRSSGNGTVIYVMRVDEVLTRQEFFSEFPKKDSEAPKTDYERHKQFALVSRHFWYFGADAICLPERFKSENPHGFKLEKKGPGFRYIDAAYFVRFLRWLQEKSAPGRHGEPCVKVNDKQNGRAKCKSSC